MDALYEFISLCVDWDRIKSKSELDLESGRATDKSDLVESGIGENADDKKRKKEVRAAVSIVFESAVRSGLPESRKALKDLDKSRAGIAMWRMP